MIAKDIAQLAEELQAREKPVGTAKILWPRLESVDPELALTLLRESPLAKFVPDPSENLGITGEGASEYYGPGEYHFSERPSSAAIVAESKGPYSDGSQLWQLGIRFSTPWGKFKIATQVQKGTGEDDLYAFPYVYDRVWVMDYAETGYEDGHTRLEGAYSKEYAEALYDIVGKLLDATVT